MRNPISPSSAYAVCPREGIIVIEHAERYGLGHLHQLRGRVARGSAQSYCLLVHDTAEKDEAARARIDVLRQTNDGFRIANADLLLGGAGNIFAGQLSGHTGSWALDFHAHGHLLGVATMSAKHAAE